MKALFKIIKDFPAYLWGGFSALASVLLFFAIWDFGNSIYGDFVLPKPFVVLKELVNLFANSNAFTDLMITSKRALIGFGFSLVLGSVLGILAGFFKTASMITRPYATIFMAMPPIAWIVLAMIWFGLGDKSVIFVVIVASFPIIFINAMQGARTLDGELKEMADAFRLGFWFRFKEIYAMHIFSYVFPGVISSFGMTWKIVVMAELLSTNDGLGAALGIARSQLDTSSALAFVVLLIGVLMIVEYIFLEPIKQEIEAWRD